MAQHEAQWCKVCGTTFGSPGCYHDPEVDRTGVFNQYFIIEELAACPSL